MEELLLAALLGDAALGALVDDRVAWLMRDPDWKGRVPVVVLHRISGATDYHHDGPSGLAETLVQADCWGLDYSAAKHVAWAVRDVAYGLLTAPLQIFVLSEADDFDTGDPADQTLFRTRLDLRVWHTA